MNTTARKARKRAGVKWQPKRQHGPKTLPVPLVDHHDPHGYIKGSLVTFLVIASAAAGYLLKWVTG